MILKYDEMQYENQEEFVITTGEKTHFMMLLFQESFSKSRRGTTDDLQQGSAEYFGSKVFCYGAFDKLYEISIHMCRGK